MDHKRAKHLNLNDIAKRAGVSRSTVSRVLNDDGYVSEETRQTVQTIINELGYSPNMGARMLRTQRTNIIGVVIPHSISNVFGDGDPHYFATLIQGIAITAQKRDFAPVLWIGNADEAGENYYRRISQNRLMDGLVIVTSIAGEYGLVDNLMKIGLPFVMIGRPLKYADTMNYVYVDNRQAGRMAVQHLVKLGRKNIATITGELTHADCADRLVGYRDMLHSAGLPIDERLILSGPFTREAGHLRMHQLLNLGVPIDAVFAATDIIALGAIDAIQEAGLRVPEDISVIGFDDLAMAQTSTPPLTTMHQPIAQKAEMATTLLLDLIEGKIEAPARASLPARLVVRESCGYLKVGR